MNVMNVCSDTHDEHVYYRRLAHVIHAFTSSPRRLCLYTIIHEHVTPSQAVRADCVSTLSYTNTHVDSILDVPAGEELASLRSMHETHIEEHRQTQAKLHAAEDALRQSEAARDELTRDLEAARRPWAEQHDAAEKALQLSEAACEKLKQDLVQARRRAGEQLSAAEEQLRAAQHALQHSEALREQLQQQLEATPAKSSRQTLWNSRSDSMSEGSSSARRGRDGATPGGSLDQQGNAQLLDDVSGLGHVAGGVLHEDGQNVGRQGDYPTGCVDAVKKQLRQAQEQLRYKDEELERLKQEHDEALETHQEDIAVVRTQILNMQRAYREELEKLHMERERMCLRHDEEMRQMRSEIAQRATAGVSVSQSGANSGLFSGHGCRMGDADGEMQASHTDQEAGQVCGERRMSSDRAESAAVAAVGAAPRTRNLGESAESKAESSRVQNKENMGTNDARADSTLAGTTSASAGRFAPEAAGRFTPEADLWWQSPKQLCYEAHTHKSPRELEKMCARYQAEVRVLKADMSAQRDAYERRLLTCQNEADSLRRQYDMKVLKLQQDLQQFEGMCAAETAGECQVRIDAVNAGRDLHAEGMLEDKQVMERLRDTCMQQDWDTQTQEEQAGPTPGCSTHHQSAMQLSVAAVLQHAVDQNMLSTSLHGSRGAHATPQCHSQSLTTKRNLKASVQDSPSQPASGKPSDIKQARPGQVGSGCSTRGECAAPPIDMRVDHAVLGTRGTPQADATLPGLELGHHQSADMQMHSPSTRDARGHVTPECAAGRRTSLRHLDYATPGESAPTYVSSSTYARANAAVNVSGREHKKCSLEVRHPQLDDAHAGRDAAHNCAVSCCERQHRRALAVQTLAKWVCHMRVCFLVRYKVRAAQVDCPPSYLFVFNASFA
jgi:hypothetical protein